MKLFLIHLLSGIGRLLLRLRGVRTGTGIILSGFPLIKKFPGASITIGNGCFIGARATILKGVTIGSGSVVAAGAVVTRDVPPGCLAIGNPAVNKPLPERLKHPRETQKAICP